MERGDQHKKSEIKKKRKRSPQGRNAMSEPLTSYGRRDSPLTNSYLRGKRLEKEKKKRLAERPDQSRVGVGQKKRFVGHGCGRAYGLGKVLKSVRWG